MCHSITRWLGDIFILGQKFSQSQANKQSGCLITQSISKDGIALSSIAKNNFLRKSSNFIVPAEFGRVTHMIIAIFLP